jgi:vancomycin resistance protein YoaR
MQASSDQLVTSNGRTARSVGFFLLGPMIGFAFLLLVGAALLMRYQSQHNGRIYTGVNVMGVELGQMNQEEAAAALAAAFPYSTEATITLTDPGSGLESTFNPAELGLLFNAADTAAAAYNIGRQGSPLTRIQEMYSSWYYGRTLSPVLTLDEAQLDAALAELAAEINQPPVNAALDTTAEIAGYTPAQNGRFLDVADARERLLIPLTQFRSATMELAVYETSPTIADTTEVSAQIQQIVNSPITFYLQEPLDEFDLAPITLTPQELSGWLRVEVTNLPDGTLQHNTYLDENAIRHWLRQYEEPLYREPVNARFYFDDATEELVLVAPHVNGRQLDIDATIAQLQEQISTPNRSIPFVVSPIVPTAHAGATAAELGITELITQTTTWFYGSSDARKHNIATGAANFYGIVIAPYEEFSFNKYLGSISEADGYEEGLIIVGGQTITGVGGGICQVSTTLYQAAFFAGFPITERLPHGYMLGYYRDGAGHGMDATVYSPIVDMKFINNTEHHLLIENYYDAENEALTFKFYSTDMGRTVEKDILPFTNVVPAPTEDRWEYRETLPPGTVEQVDWATEGADVVVTRVVYNRFGEPMYGDIEYFVSNYIPVPNVFHYGPGVEPYDYSLVPDEE